MVRAHVSIVLNVLWATVALLGVSSYAERKLRRTKAFGRKRKNVA